MKFILGIGNPGREYQNTRHNIGFRTLDLLKKTFSQSLRAKVLLVKPKTFVNRTGEEASWLLEKNHGEPSQLLVVCDDVNLPLGVLRLRAAGSSGGHKGLQSIIETLGTRDFARLRLGIGVEAMPKDLAGFVLEVFSREEEKKLKAVLEKAAVVCQAWAVEGVSAAQNKINKQESV